MRSWMGKVVTRGGIAALQSGRSLERASFEVRGSAAKCSKRELQMRVMS